MSIEQQHINKRQPIELAGMQIQEQHQKCSHLQQAKLNNVSRSRKNSSKEILPIEHNGKIKEAANHAIENIPKDQEDPIEEDNINDEQNFLLNEKTLDKKLKIKHNKKCSGCIKKHLNQNVVNCLNCPKSYHRSCINTSNLKITQPFFCQNCQEILKERQQRKNNKKQMCNMKQTQLKKLPKIQERIIKPVVSLQQIKSSVPAEIRQFAQRFPLYIQNGKIQFPIEDSLLEEYASIMPKANVYSKPLPTKILPKYFGTMLQVWNTIQTLDEDMSEYSRLSITQLSQLMQSKGKLVAVEKLFINLLGFVSRDIFNERFENNKSFFGSPFLCLLKYCSETGSLSRIFKYVWVELLHQLSGLNEFSVIFRDPNLILLIKTLRERIKQHFTPELFDEKLLLLQSMLNGVVQTTSYHDDLYLKIQKGRQNIRLKNDAIEKVKQIQAELKDIAQRKKVLVKQIKDNTKQMNQPSSDRTKYQKQVSILQSQQKSLQIKQSKLKQTVQIQRQNVSLASNGINYTNVWFLGKDKEQRDYWFIPNYRDRLFVSSDPQSWYEYNLSTINELIKSLNIKGIREKQLHENLTSYKKSNYFGNVNENTTSELQRLYQQQKQFEQNRETYIKSNGQVDFDKEEYISFQFITKILLLGQKKIFTYLDEKKARWGPPEDRQAFISRIKASSTTRDLIEAAKFLNQKICVVQIEYIVIGEDGQQITDLSKMRKVQTKMWGINEKYKHAWLQYLANCNENSLMEVFFLNAILFLTIDRYVSKMRDPKKPKRDFGQDVPASKQNTILNKRNPAQKKNPNKIQWEQTCGVCNLFGELLCCDLCPKVFHLNCIGLTQIPQGNYKCKQCQSKRHTRSITRKIVVDSVQEQ